MTPKRLSSSVQTVLVSIVDHTNMIQRIIANRRCMWVGEIYAGDQETPLLQLFPQPFVQFALGIRDHDGPFRGQNVGGYISACFTRTGRADYQRIVV